MTQVPSPTGVVAVLTAAGSGARLGAGGPKALVEIDGVSLLRRSAAGLLDSGVVDRVVVTAPAAHVGRFAEELAGLADDALEVVAGSPASRQASVAIGLDAALAALPGAGVVLVHDAARALTPPQVVRRVVAAVRAGHEAVVPAVPVTDTVKQVAEPGPQDGEGVERVTGTPRRAALRAVQTPQGFRPDVLLAAHRLGAERAHDEALAASDDAGLVEAGGGAVVVVPGDPLAIKVTTPLDLALATLLSRDRDI
ncbi:MAG: 2-C-methyl-D-erythritol 4-phosphate cytidylyltransferase [Actinomyces sp.]|uniref:IspD/TarI family cytidylyltransferase n=1 Tax=Actinomyces sp. TaxID=29317 RepID=UPI0026DBDBA6|nr:2-C-methyl-D-erythritol 4-phosphate cytidylyltransferase [Actinomyces sp.]MDO4243103.1 2-C-methyl-D-erythritol 4-phosphate cytidylyltransferase [Actinomyces sp.]